MIPSEGLIHAGSSMSEAVWRCTPLGETQNQPFSSLSMPLKVDFQGSRVTCDGGLILIRELNERLGL